MNDTTKKNVTTIETEKAVDRGKKAVDAQKETATDKKHGKEKSDDEKQDAEHWRNEG